jgi:two-component system OmpR family sensor kinase
MLGRVESEVAQRQASERSARESEDQMRRFVADASHELRTPLTSIRGFAELHRQGELQPAEADHLLERIESEATRMSGLVEDLLLLARLDQKRPMELCPVDVVPIAADAAHDAHLLEPDRTVRLVLPEAGDNPSAGSATVVTGDEAQLRQVVANLVSNALAHTPPGTPLEVGVEPLVRDGRQWVALHVTDEGPGLPADVADRIFERFYRADKGRSRATGGSGLGLSIANAIVAAHGGHLTVDTAPGAGATFRVLLPGTIQDPLSPS